MSDERIQAPKSYIPNTLWQVYKRARAHREKEREKKRKQERNKELETCTDSHANIHSLEFIVHKLMISQSTHITLINLAYLINKSQVSREGIRYFSFLLPFINCIESTVIFPFFFRSFMNWFV